MKETTNFQHDCEKRLVDAVNGTGKSLSVRRIDEIPDTFFDRDTDTYIHYEVIGTAIEVWIYDDGAMFSGPDLDQRYEAEDFATPEALIDQFLAELTQAIGKIGIGNL